MNLRLKRKSNKIKTKTKTSYCKKKGVFSNLYFKASEQLQTIWQKQELKIIFGFTMFIKKLFEIAVLIWLHTVYCYGTVKYKLLFLKLTITQPSYILYFRLNKYI